MRWRHQKRARQQKARAAGHRTERSLIDGFAPLRSNPSVPSSRFSVGFPDFRHTGQPEYLRKTSGSMPACYAMQGFRPPIVPGPPYTPNRGCSLDKHPAFLRNRQVCDERSCPCLKGFRLIAPRSCAHLSIARPGVVTPTNDQGG